MAHIARRDHWVGVWAAPRGSALLVEPARPLTCDDISEIREEICDNYVVLAQGEGRRLARILVELAARVDDRPAVALDARRPGTQTDRVDRPRQRLLNKERNMETRMNFGRKCAVRTCGLVRC